MHRRVITSAIASVAGGLTGFCNSLAAAPPPLPQYDHVVVVIEENKGYPTIIGSANAPYINKLATEGTSFTQFYALPHTSAPNYGELFGGYHNNIPDNGLVAGWPLTTPNLGAEIRAAGLTFGGYAQSLPSVGFTGEFSGNYVRRHNPWVNWQNDGPTPPVHPNHLPSAVNMPFTMFPTNFDNLPTVSFVVPDNANNMHDSGAVPISTADTWLKNNIDAYYQWAKTHNSLLILTYDEDGHETNNYNRIPTIFAGAGVKPGATVASSYTLHNFLRTVEDLYGTAHAASAARVKAMNGAFVSDAPGVIKTFREGSGGYTGAHDTHIRTDQPAVGFGSATILSSDLDTDSGTAGNQQVQGLVRFDNIIGSGAGQIPSGATISSAKLILFSDTAAGGETANPVSIHRMLTTWSETSTWNSLSSGIAANDAEAAASPDFSNAPVTLGHPWFFDVSDTVQAYANGAANFGWAVLPTGLDEYRFNSSESATVNFRPALEVTYLLMSQWKNTAGSSWNNAANWNGGIPNASGAIVTLGNATTSPNSTLTLDGSRVIGKLTFDHTNSYIIAPGTGGSLTITNGAYAPAEVRVLRGSHTIQAAVNLTSHANLDIAAGSTLTLTATTTVEAGRRISKLGPGRLNTANVSLQTGSILSVNAGNVVASAITGGGGAEIHNGGQLTLQSTTSASKLSSLSFDGSANAWQGQLDLKNSTLIVQATAATRQAMLNSVLNQIRTGRNGNSTRWTGQGISSSVAAAEVSRTTAIGAILNDNGSGGVLYSTFFGQSVDINSILIRYTLNGDLDLDGGVGADDYAKMDAGFAQKLTGWGNGDIDYSGSINADDFFLMDHAFSSQTMLPAPQSPLAGAATAVPEPAAMASVGLILLSTRRCGRRSRGRCSRSHTRSGSSPASAA